MITAGEFPIGARLPTVRELSRRLGVSPTTVSEAWRNLADVGAIEARGRNGTYVRPPTGPGGPRRYRRITEGPGHFELDLSTGTPDPALLPDLSPVVSRVGKQSLTSSYLDHPVLPALEDELRASWPFAPKRSPSSTGRWTPSIASPGSCCASVTGSWSSNPASLPCSTCSTRSAAWWSASTSTTTARAWPGCSRRWRPATCGRCSCSPGRRTRPGARLTPRRAQALADVLADCQTIVVEDDHADDIASAPR